ncbi:hypothetical protein BCR44DRAFT_1449105, partial [Catenaria anguillulae PL171]
MAQWLRRRASTVEVMGSNPTGGDPGIVFPIVLATSLELDLVWLPLSSEIWLSGSKPCGLELAHSAAN